MADPQSRRVAVNLLEQRVTTPRGERIAFMVEDEARERLLGGLAAIDLTLRRAANRAVFRAAHRRGRPWVYL
jgi:3-isopropylmalate/(R)-2-methylmalate dehydratase small subunit